MKAIDPAFPIFCLCAVIVSRDDFASFDRRWKTWKAEWLKSWQERVHEPDVRRRSRRFYDVDPARQQARIDALSAQLNSLTFTCVAAVIDKRELQRQFPSGSVDEFLPASTYLMCINFVFERVVHFLFERGNDAYGLVISEARGLREDAEVAAQFIRLQLTGTQFISDSYFRNQLRPYVEFRRKERNESGLQIADLLARPVAEKVIAPASTPERWPEAAAKLDDGGQNRRSSYGLKVFPTRDIRGGPRLKQSRMPKHPRPPTRLMQIHYMASTGYRPGFQCECHRYSHWPSGIDSAAAPRYVRRRSSWRSRARPISRATSSGSGIPVAAQSIGYMLIEVKPGIVFTSLM